jgi:hypothetical protein
MPIPRSEIELNPDVRVVLQDDTLRSGEDCSMPPSLGRKLGKWVTFSLMFAALPVGFDIAVRTSQNQPLTLEALLGSGTGILIGFGTLASGLGELVFDKQMMGSTPPSFILGIAASAALIAVGALYYGIIGSPGANVGMSVTLTYLIVSVVMGFAVVTVSV